MAERADASTAATEAVDRAAGVGPAAEAVALAVVVDLAEAVARVEAQLPLARSRAEQLENRLAVLMGRPPGSLDPKQLAPGELPDVGQLPSVGVPRAARCRSRWQNRIESWR